MEAIFDEPFQAIDCQLQGMTTDTEDEWMQVARRLDNIPRFLEVAQDQLLAGVTSNNVPDWRMLQRYGIDAADTDVGSVEQIEHEALLDRRIGHYERFERTSCRHSVLLLGNPARGIHQCPHFLTVASSIEISLSAPFVLACVLVHNEGNLPAHQQSAACCSTYCRQYPSVPRRAERIRRRTHESIVAHT